MENTGFRKGSIMGIEEAIDQISREKSEAVKTLQFFDINIWLGKPLYFPLAEELDIALLEVVLQRYSIHGGLLSHWDGPALSAQEGNRALLEVQEKLPQQLYTIWTGLPLIPREQGPLPGFDKPDARTRGVRLFPKSHHYTLSPWVVGDLCQWCIAHGLPLFLWHVEIEWEALYILAKAFPKLKIIIESQWQKILYHNRNLYSLMKDNENVFLETSNFVGQDFITHAVGTLGVEHLLFGSFLPINDPWTSIGMLMDADISDYEKRLIAGENIRTILHGVRI
jgi:hypothetical protein